MSEYWTICAEAAVEDAGIPATSEQIQSIAKMMERGHQDYGDQHGHREADRSLTRMNREEARAKVFAFVEEQMAMLDNGPNFFDRMSFQQKEALARLMHVRKEFARRLA
jgi:hypothetical protein